MRLGVWAAPLALGFIPATLRADPPALEAHVECERTAQPGRVLCELTCHARHGTLVWSDALVVRAPDFAGPLRSRVLVQLGAPGAPGAAELVSSKLALVATRAGEGTLELLVRGVVCRARTRESRVLPDGCAPESVAVSTLVRVAGAAAP